MKKLLLGLVLLSISSSVLAIPVTMVEQQSNWNYTVIGTDLWPIWSSVNYTTYTTSTASATWSNGNAAFGNGTASGNSYSTSWAANTDLALTTTFDFSGVASNLLLNVASDNGFVVFLNGDRSPNKMPRAGRHIGNIL